MSYKPFSAIDLVKNYYDRAARGSRAAFVQLENYLKILELPECDTVQVKNIALTDAVEISDDGTLTISGGGVNYALVCEGTPGATGILPTPFGFSDPKFFCLSLKIQFQEALTQTCPLWSLHTETATRIEYGIEMPGYKPYVDIGPNRYYSALQGGYFEPFEHWIGQWVELGAVFSPVYSDVGFLTDGGVNHVSVNYGAIPASDEDLLDVGCAGVAITELVWVWGWSNCPNPYVANSGGYTPMPKQRPLRALNYYNFTPNLLTPGSIPDLSPNATYRTNLLIQTDNAALEAVEIV